MFLFLVVAATLLPATTLEAAEPHAILARGFEPDQIYDFNDIDHVNLFNGNLVVTIPIGQRYPVNAGFEYGFTLVYNSHIWDYVKDCPNDPDDTPETINLIDPSAAPAGCVRGIPNQKSNAGTSWRLSLGELYDIESSLFPGRNWVFVGPDGSERRFEPKEGETESDFPQFTRDGSYLRLRSTSSGVTPACDGIVGTCMAVDAPSGTVYAFEPTNSPAGWRLKRIEDTFGNWVSVDYQVDRWLVYDSQGRQHTVTFDASGMVSGVTLEAFGAGTAQYGFATSSSPAILPACPHDFQDGESPKKEILTYLDAVTLPDGSRYDFSYVTDDGPQAFCSRYEGRLRRIGLPTGGEIEYAYGGSAYPVRDCDTPTARYTGGKTLVATQYGVSSRTARGIGGADLSEVHYQAATFDALSPTYQSYISSDGVEICERPRTTFTDVYEKADQGRYRLTRHFFSIYPETVTASDRRYTETKRYGLPVDFLTPDATFGREDPDRLRSSMVFDCPSFPAPTEDYGPNCAFDGSAACWPADAQHLKVPSSCYDVDGDGDTADRFFTPEEVRGLRDRYLEHESGSVYYCGGAATTTPDCETDHWRIKNDTTYFYDSPGDYFVETERSDFDGYGHYREAKSSSNSPDSVTRTTELTYIPEITSTLWMLELLDERKITEAGQTSRETYGYDRTNGFLETRTTHRGAGNLVATFTPDDFGNTETETYSGGDPGRPGYEVWNKFQNGSLSRSEYVRNAETVLLTVDAAIDANTGLPSASRDQSGLETWYSFDTMGRLTSMVQQGALAEAATSYLYDPFDTVQGTRARVTVTRGDTVSYLFFDGLGRVQEERTVLPGGITNRQLTTFTPMGQPDRQTTLHDKDEAATARETRTDYDVFGRPARVWRPDDGLTLSGTSQTLFWYEGIFKTLREVQDVETPDGPQPLRTNLLYDHQGRLVGVEEIENDSPSFFEVRLRTKYRYDEGGRLVQVSQGGGTQVRTFQYDEAGLLTRECHPELAGGCIEYGGFDARGNPGRLRYSLAGGAPFELDYAYDGAERPTQVRSAQDGRLLKELFYTNLYNEPAGYTPAQGNGKLYQSKRHNYLGPLDVVATVTNTYAGVGGRLSERLVTTGGDGDVPRVRFTTGFAYDPLGNLARITYPDCLQVGCATDAPSRDITRSYTRGLLTAVGTAADADHYASLTYNANMTLGEVAHGNGVTDDLAEDPSQLPRSGGLEVRTGASPGAGTLWQATYTYDGSGNIVARTSRGWNDSGAQLFDGTDEFRYDNAFNRLVSSTIHYPSGAAGAQDSRSYSYDPFGNLTTVSSSANPRILSPDPATNRLQSPFTYDDAGNLTSQPEWDFAGNPTGPPAWYYDFDPFNRMTRARKAGGSVERHYLYTADGERLAILSPGRELWTVRGVDNQVLRDIEYLSTGWRWVEDYVHRGTSLLATIDDTYGERHHHLDHLGSPRLVTDLSQQVLARHVFAPYGEELTVANQDELRMKFTGHERDELDASGSTGDLDYMKARNYSPTLARFLALDPVHFRTALQHPQLWNRYNYAIGNPIKYVDPNGQTIAFPPNLRSSVESAYRRSPTFRTVYDRHHSNTEAVGRIRRPGTLTRNSSQTHGATTVDTRTDSPVKYVCDQNNVCKPRTTRTVTTLPEVGGDQLQEILGHEIQHMIEFFQYGSPDSAPDKKESGSGIQGDIETDAAIEVQEKIEEELKDPSDDIELTSTDMDRLFGYSDENPKCARKGGAACPDPE